MVKAVRETEKAIGKIDYNLTAKQIEGKQFARSLYVCKDINIGDVFTEQNIRSVRPGYGLHPKYFKEILGKIAVKNYTIGDRLEL